MNGVFEGAIPTPATVEENIQRGMMAMRHVIASHKMEPHAMWRKDIGWIGFEWGRAGNKPPEFQTQKEFRAWQKSGGKPFDGGYGVAHIIEKRDWEGKHIVEFLGQKGSEVAYQLVEVIAYASPPKATSHTIQLKWNNIVVFLRKKRKEEGKIYWLLSGYSLVTQGYKYVFESAGENGGVYEPPQTLCMPGLHSTVQSWEQQTQPESNLPTSSTPCKNFVRDSPDYGSADYGFALNI